MIKTKQYYESLDKRTKEFKQWQNTQQAREVNVNQEKPVTGLENVLQKEQKENKYTQTFKIPVSKENAKLNLSGEMVTELNKSLGMGDVLEKILEHPAVKPVTNIVKKLIFKDGKDCGCNDRKEKLNAILPRRFKAVKCLTEEEHKAWGLFVKKRTLKIERPTIVMVCKLYSRIFQRQYYEPCGGCSPKILIHMIDKLDTVYNSYESK